MSQTVSNTFHEQFEHVSQKVRREHKEFQNNVKTVSNIVSLKLKHMSQHVSNVSNSIIEVSRDYTIVPNKSHAFSTTVFRIASKQIQRRFKYVSVIVNTVSKLPQ